MNTEADLKSIAEGELKKAPRKPRPSEIAARKARAAKKKKVKPKAKKAAVKRPVKKAKKSAKRKVSKPKAKAAGPDRSERIDMRVTKADKARVIAKAKKLRRTVTSVVMEAIEKIK